MGLLTPVYKVYIRLSSCTNWTDGQLFQCVPDWEFCDICALDAGSDFCTYTPVLFLPHLRLQGTIKGVDACLCVYIYMMCVNMCSRDSDSKREKIIDNCSIITVIMPYFIPMADLGSCKCSRKLESIKRDIFPPAKHVETGLSSSTLHLCLSAVCLLSHFSPHTSHRKESIYFGFQNDFWYIFLQFGQILNQLIVNERCVYSKKR